MRAVFRLTDLEGGTVRWNGAEVGVASATARNTATVGVIALFLMLSQYLTWTLFGVMEEKSSRVVEVLLSTVRPLQLLTGKVLGIAIVVFRSGSTCDGIRVRPSPGRRLEPATRHRSAGAAQRSAGSCSATASTAGSAPQPAPPSNGKTKCRHWPSRCPYP